SLVAARDREALAAALLAQGDGAGAEPLYREALAARVEAQGARHPEVAELRTRLGILLEAKGALEAAEEQYRLSAEAVPDGEVLDRLSALAEARGDLDAAENYAKRTLEQCERALGPLHPKTAAARNALGLLA